jgi:hypothetical protein
MPDKWGFIRNPLTVIGIFAAIAEVSGTVVLPLIAEANQLLFTWFLMGFPVMLVLLFFATLNFNHKVLYAPSDFKGEENFFKPLSAVSSGERVEKLKVEVSEITSETPPNPISQTVQSPRSVAASYLLAEELVLGKLSKELGKHIKREVGIHSAAGRLIFDGAVVDGKRVTAIEVKYTRGSEVVRRIREMTSKIVAHLDRATLPSEFSIILAVVVDSPDVDVISYLGAIEQVRDSVGVPVDIRLYSMPRLMAEAGIQN